MALLSRFSGVRNAFDYAYGVNPSVPPLKVSIGNVLTGVQTVTLSLGQYTLNDGTNVIPLSTTVPIIAGTGPNAETITPSAVQNPSPGANDTAQVTANYTKLHGIGDGFSTSTLGLAEAVISAHAAGGGLVAIDGRFVQAAGSLANALAMILTVKGFTDVTILDWSGTSGALSYKAANGANYAATTTVLY